VPELESEETTTTMSASVTQPEVDIQAMLQEALAQLATLSARIETLEEQAAANVRASAVPAPLAEAALIAPTAPVSPEAAEPGITEEEVLAISAAIAAYLGVHAHIRQIRLIRSSAWAQQGRVTIQASHGLNH
jgi:methylmalonyl-CoA carboxyltransferase 12S subunit